MSKLSVIRFRKKTKEIERFYSSIIERMKLLWSSVESILSPTQRRELILNSETKEMALHVLNGVKNKNTENKSEPDSPKGSLNGLFEYNSNLSQKNSSFKLFNMNNKGSQNNSIKSRDSQTSRFYAVTKNDPLLGLLKNI